MTVRIGVIVGSTPATSINSMLADAVADLAQVDSGTSVEACTFERIAIDHLPLYDRELDETYPEPAMLLKRTIESCDGLIIATPEYNRSIPGALKNAIDWASRPSGFNSFAGKPVGMIGASIGAIGTALAQQHLRSILAYLDAPTMAQPEAYIQFTENRFGPDGAVRDESTREFLRT